MTTKDAQSEPVDNISDDVAKAISEVEETEVEATEDTTEPEVKEPETDEPEAEVDEPEDDVELNLPEHWSEQDKTEFSSVKDRKSALSFVERRYKEMEAGVTKKFQEIASIRKKGEALEEVLAPHRGDYNLQGMDDIGAVRQLFAIASNLKANPQETITRLAQQYGVSLQQEEGQIDPALQTVTQRLNELQRQQSQSIQQLHQREQQQLQEQITAFQSQKDEQGQPKYPHFEQVRATMGQLMQSSLATTMEDAYSKAVSLRSDLKPMVQVKTLDKAAAATKAKKAASGVKSAGTAVKTQAPQNKSIRDDILAAIGDNEIRI